MRASCVGCEQGSHGSAPTMLARRMLVLPDSSDSFGKKIDLRRRLPQQIVRQGRLARPTLQGFAPGVIPKHATVGSPQAWRLGMLSPSLDKVCTKAPPAVHRPRCIHRPAPQLLPLYFVSLRLLRCNGRPSLRQALAGRPQGLVGLLGFNDHHILHVHSRLEVHDRVRHAHGEAQH